MIDGGVTIEALARAGTDVILAFLRTQLAGATGALTELSIGYDQTRYFCRYALREPHDVLYLHNTPDLAVPRITAAFTEDREDEDAEDVREAWFYEWYEARAQLGVLAAALTLLDVRTRPLPVPLAPACRFGVFDDIEHVRDGAVATAFHPLGAIDEQWMMGDDALAELFERPATLAWVRALAAHSTLTIAVLDALAAEFPVCALLAV